MRRGRPEAAIEMTRRSIVGDWRDNVIGADGEIVHRRMPSPDIDFAKQHGIFFMKEEGRTKIVIAPKDMKKIFGRLRAVLFYEIHAAGYSKGGVAVPPDPVVAVIIDGEREVFLHSYLQRVLQRACQLTLLPAVEPMFMDGSHAYRPGRSRYTALEQARRYVRQGCHWATSCDVRRFFPSIGLGLLERVLEVGFPWIAPDLRELILWTCCPAVIYRPSHHRRAPASCPLVTPPPGHLLQGSVLGPMLANMVAHELIDRPMAMAQPKVRLVRYADDILILARSPAEVEDARGVIGDLLTISGLQLHPHKGQAVAIDLRRDPLLHLGKYLHGGEVRTPERDIDRHVDRITTATLGSREFRTAVGAAVADLCLDRRRRLHYLRRELRRRSRLHSLWFDELAGTVGTSRRQNDPEEVHDQGLAALAKQHADGVRLGVADASHAGKGDETQMKDQRDRKGKATGSVRAKPVRVCSGSYSLSQGSGTIDGPADALPTHVGRGGSRVRASADSNDATSAGIMMTTMRSPAGPGAIPDRRERLQQQRAASVEHEERIAALVGGTRVAGSGSLGELGDVRTAELLISCKQTTQTTRKIVADIIEVCGLADSASRTPTLVYEFLSLPDQVEKDWALVPLRVLAAMTERSTAAEDCDGE